MSWGGRNGDRGSVGVEPDRVETRATVSHLQHGDAACRSFEGERQQKINTYKQKFEAGPSQAPPHGAQDRAGRGVVRVYSESNAPSHDSAIEHGCLTLIDCLGSVHLQLQHALMLRCPIARSCHTPQPVSSTEPFPVHVHSGPPLAPSFPAPCVYSQMQTEIHTAHCRLCANDGFRVPVPQSG